MNKLLINTPQNVNFEYKLASVGSRCMAFGLDYGIMILYAIFMFTVLPKTGVFNSNDPWLSWGVSSFVTLPIFLYPLILETLMEGQTIGKRIMKIKVVKIDGTRATFYQYFIRWVCNAIDIFMSMGGLGLTSIILTQKSQRIGDIAAETAVINIKEDIGLKETLFEEITATHAITYPEVIKLTDRDLNEIKEIYHTGFRRKNYTIIQALAAKVEILLGVKANIHPEDFISQVIKDHYYMFKEQS
ncbi:RDD family protein [Sphingobacterium faecale]|uniref:RDD family protein n=1 Tax=Sphingobacterium faecale TaxID=2803775 RepID=A0ABS1R952_9SPHI|nr:RDD family protein [Sphingobacterium faecale]MBL1410527.1 RDD family protein [Sphingobacterium faecale]